MPNGRKTIKVYDELDECYWSFMTPGASQALDTYSNSRSLNGEDKQRVSNLYKFARSKQKRQLASFNSLALSNHIRYNETGCNSKDKKRKKIFRRLSIALCHISVEGCIGKHVAPSNLEIFAPLDFIYRTLIDDTYNDTLGHFSKDLGRRKIIVFL